MENYEKANELVKELVELLKNGRCFSDEFCMAYVAGYLEGIMVDVALYGIKALENRVAQLKQEAEVV